MSSQPHILKRKISMDIRRIAGIVYAAATGVVVAFQIALALGAPWGAYAMGGAYPGQFPPAMRAAALVQAGILLGFAGIVLSRAGITLQSWERVARWMIWVVVGFSALSLALNLITPSASERMLWSPVAFVLLVCSLLVATGRKQ
jgi:hypothetical protein